MRLLSVDGGGTKLNAILTDEYMDLLGKGVSGGVNPNQLSAETARAHVVECLDQVFAAELPETLDEVVVIFVGDLAAFQAELEARVSVKKYTVLNEAQGALLAGSLSREGLVALSGTGSAVYSIQNGVYERSGGRGPILGDAGSGVWIGHRALRAAVRELDGWGEATRLTPLILEGWDAVGDPWKLVSIVHGGGAPYSRIASLTRAVARAAEEGDPMALQIIWEAGRLMAEQMLCLIQRLKAPPAGPKITLCGGAWKTHPAMLEAFLNRMHQVWPEAEAHRPMFEHVCAGPVLFLLEQGLSRGEIETLLHEKMAEYAVISK